MTTGETPVPGIKVLPPLVYLVFLVTGGVAEWRLPVVFFPLLPRFVAGIALAIAALLIVFSAMRTFRKAKTPFDVRKAASSLVTEGLFRFSRNPGYLALTLFYIAIGVMAGSVWILALLVPPLAIMHFAVIFREEKNLEEIFGEEYMRYKASVRRWL